MIMSKAYYLSRYAQNQVRMCLPYYPLLLESVTSIHSRVCVIRDVTINYPPPHLQLDLAASLSHQTHCWSQLSYCYHGDWGEVHFLEQHLHLQSQLADMFQNPLQHLQNLTSFCF